MEPAPGSLWDFVSQTPFDPIRYVLLATKFFGINYLHVKSIPLLRWHTVCSLLGNLKRLASRGGRNRTSTRCPVLGRQLEKGGLHQPPFSICAMSSRECVAEAVLVVVPVLVLMHVGAGHGPPLFLAPTLCTTCVSWPTQRPKKVSGRWGERPLGRGDGGYCNPKLALIFRPFCCAREQQDDTQEQTRYYHLLLRKPQPTPDYTNDSAPHSLSGR